MTIRASSTPNIALIKYWGNRNDEWRLPAADSLSITLDEPTMEVAVDEAEQFSARSFQADGMERYLTSKEISRLEKHFILAKNYLNSVGAKGIFTASVSLEIRSKIPPGIGLASSAALFSALAEAYAAGTEQISRRDVSILARLGSGSASRSTFPGFVAMFAGEGNAIDASYAQQVAPANHWKLFDVIIAPSLAKKEMGSTEGHALAYTSPLFAARMRALPERQRICTEAILQKDLEKLRSVAEEDCLDMHAVMTSSTPALNYLSQATHRIVREIEELRAAQHLAVLYTMDAGPTVHLVCEESALPAVRAYAHAQTACAVFEARVGRGSRLL